MATYNGILRFAEQDDGTNILQQGDYAADPQRTFGHQPGAARRILENKVLRQTSLASAGVAQFIADHQSEDVTDDMSTQQFADALGNAIASRSPGSAESVQITSGVKKLIEDNGGSIGTTPAETAAALDSTVDAIAGDNADVKRSAAVADGVTGYINGQGIPTPDPATPQLITSALQNAINQNITNDGGYQFSNTTAQGVYVFCGENGIQPPWPGEQGYGAAAIGQAIGEAVIKQMSGIITPITVDKLSDTTKTTGDRTISSSQDMCLLLGSDTYKMSMRLVAFGVMSRVEIQQGNSVTHFINLPLTTPRIGTTKRYALCIPNNAYSGYQASASARHYWQNDYMRVEFSVMANRNIAAMSWLYFNAVFIDL